MSANNCNSQTKLTDVCITNNNNLLCKDVKKLRKKNYHKKYFFIHFRLQCFPLNNMMILYIYIYIFVKIWVKKMKEQTVFQNHRYCKLCLNNECKHVSLWSISGHQTHLKFVNWLNS